LASCPNQNSPTDSSDESNYDYRGTPETYQSYEDTFLPACQSGNWSPEQNFFTDDPQKKFPKWKTDTWKLIRSGQVAIGMTKEMLDVACGIGLVQVGYVLSDGQSSDVYECNGRKFLVRDGKVTKYEN
jgi:hypothetical protein